MNQVDPTGSSSTSRPGTRRPSSSPATARRADSSRQPPGWHLTSGTTPRVASTPSTTWSPGPTSSGSWTRPLPPTSPRLRPKMADRKTADRKRGTPQGSPSFAFQPRKALVGDHSGCLVAGQPGGRGRQGDNQLGEVVDFESVDRRRTCRQTMTCSPRCGSSPKGLPFSSELSDGGGVHDRRDPLCTPGKTQKIFADRQSGASDGWRSGGWFNPQVGGFITLVMSPIITSRQASRGRPTDKPPWTPEAASPQVGGFITLVMSPIITSRQASRGRPTERPPWGLSAASPQVGGFITLVMSPIITSRPALRNRPTERPPWGREAASPQVGGFITSARGVHHAPTASTPAELSTMNRTTTPRPNRSLSPSARITPVEPTAAERRPECPAAHRAAGHLPSPTWSGRHMACPQRQRAFGIANAGCPCLRDACVTSPSPPGRRERYCREPVGLTLQSPFARIPLALRVDEAVTEAVTEAESKIDEQLHCSWRRRRRPRPGPVPEVLSGSLHWATGSKR